MHNSFRGSGPLPRGSDAHDAAMQRGGRHNVPLRSMWSLVATAGTAAGRQRGGDLIYLQHTTALPIPGYTESLINTGRSMKTRITLHTKLGKSPENGFERLFVKTVEMQCPLTPGMTVGPLIWLQFEVWRSSYLLDDHILEVSARQASAFQEDVDHIAEKLLQNGWQELH